MYENTDMMPVYDTAEQHKSTTSHVSCRGTYTASRTRVANATISSSRHVALCTLCSVSPLSVAWAGPRHAFVTGGVDHDFATRGPRAARNI